MRALRAGAAFLLLELASLSGEQPAALHYRLQMAGSDLSWELPATLHTVHGRAPEFSGRVDAVPGTGGEWKIEVRIVVRAAAMVTGNASRDRRMREKVLETDRFPEIIFESHQVTADLSRFQTGERFTVETIGELMVHGKMVSIRLPVDVSVLPDHVVLQGSFPLPWKQFGVQDPSFGIVTVREPMRVLFRLSAVEAAGAGK